MPAAGRLADLMGYPIPDRRERRKRVGSAGRSLRRECRLRARSAHLVVDGWNTTHFSASATNGLITKILPPADYSHVSAVLANAVYLKGMWTTAFNTDRTMAAPFTLADGTEVSCQMMNQTGSFPYFSGADFQAVELPYGQTGRFSMLIILPAAGVDLGGFVANMTGEELSTWVADLEPAEVGIGLPRFTANYSSSLVSALASLGMGVAFDHDSADFANLSSLQGVYISDVEHETAVQVDESGTVAAGSTTGTVGVTVVPPSMTMNRPLFYAIVDGKTGALVFIGTLVDPTRSGAETPPARHGLSCATIEMVYFIDRPGGKVMRELTTVGIDLAKNVFAVHAVDRDGRVVLRRLVAARSADLSYRI